VLSFVPTAAASISRIIFTMKSRKRRWSTHLSAFVTKWSSEREMRKASDWAKGKKDFIRVEEGVLDRNGLAGRKSAA